MPIRSPTVSSAWVFPAAVFFVLAVATFLRFWHLTDQGFTGYDEGWLIDVAQRAAQEWRQGDLKTYSDFKSSHTTWALLTGTFLTFGVSSRSIQYPFALFGVLDVAALMWLACLLFDRRVALVTGLFLATSPFHTMYSRTVGIETPGILFFVSACALTCIAARAARPSTPFAAAVATGAAMALAATANYRAVVCLPVPLLMLPFLVPSVKRFTRATAGYAVGLALVFGAWDVFLRTAYPETGGYFHAMLHSDQSRIAYAFRGVGSVLERFRIAQPYFYLRTLWDLGNPALFALVGLAGVLLLVGVMLRVAGRSKVVGGSDVALLVACALPALGLSAIEYKAPRAFSIVEPLLILLAARGVVLLWNAAAGMRGLGVLLRAAAALCVVLAVAIGLDATLQEDVIGRSNGFRRAFTEVGDKPDGILVVLDRYIPDFYARETGRRYSVLGMGSTLGDVVVKVKGGYRFLLLDGQFAVFQSYLSYVWPALEAVDPSILIPAPNYIRVAHFLEHAMHLSTSYDQELERYHWWTRRWGRNLPVYDLQSIVRPLEWAGAGDRWYRVGTGIVALKERGSKGPGKEIVVDEGSAATSVQTRLIFDYNRLPVEGGIGLVRTGTEGPEGVVYYWWLNRKENRELLGRFRAGEIEPLASQQALPINPETRISLTWREGIVRVGLDQRTVLEVPMSGQATAPEEPRHPALLASPTESLELREFTSEPAGQQRSGLP